eukprot:gene5531-9348_t
MEDPEEKNENVIQIFNEFQPTSNGLVKKRKEEETPKFEIKRETSIPQKSSSFTNYEYQSGRFLYSISTLVPLILGLFPILALTGKFSIAIMVFGLTIVYILDFLSFSRFTLPTFWATIGIFWAFTYFSSLMWLWTSFFNAFILAHAGLYVITFGFWGSLHSNYFKNWSPELTILFERLLVSVGPIVCMPLVMSVVIAVNGIENSPYYLSLYLCAVCYFFVSPKRSSFKVGKDDENVYIQQRNESMILVLLTQFLPCLFYLIIIHQSFKFSPNQIINFFMLLSMPTLFFFTKPNQFLWFWYKEDIHAFKKNLIIFTASFMILCWLEFHIIFKRYSYLFMMPAPYSYIVVSVGLYTALGVFLIQNRFISVFLACVSSSSAAVALGFPMWIIPVVSLAGFCGSSFYYSKSFTQYLLFAGSSSITVIWWLHKSFTFLDYEFKLTILPIDWTMSMTDTTYLISLLFIFLVSTPIFALKKIQFLTTASLFLSAISLAVLEQLLYEQGEGFYSNNFVLLTTVLGIILSLALYNKNRISVNGASVLLALFFSKLGIFLLPNRMVMIAAFATSVTFTRIYMSETLRPIYGWGYFLITGSSLFVFRHNLLEPMAEFALGEITESRLLGLVVLSLGIFVLPLSYKFMKQIKLMRKLNIFLIVIGSIWSFAQPSMSTTSWIPWIMILVVIFLLLNVLEIINLPNNTYTRSLLFLFIGVSFGLGFSGTWLYSYHTMALTCCIFVLAIFVLYSAHFPIVGGYKSCLSIYFGFLTLLPITYFTTYQKIEILSLFNALNIFLAIIIKFKLSGQPLLNATRKDTTGMSVPDSDELALVSNTATFFSYLIGVVLVTLIDPTKPFTYILLSALFLLLNRDSKFLVEFLEPTRYLIVVASIQISMVVYFLNDIFVVLKVAESLDDVLPDIFTNIGILLLIIPCHAIFDLFLWKLKRPNVNQVFFSAIPCFIAILLVKYASLYWLGIIGCFGAVLQIFTATQWSRQVTFPI